MAHPIWKDYIITIPNVDSFGYLVYFGNTLVYEGKAYRKPGASAIEIKINDICADYINKSTLPTTFPMAGGTAQPYIFEFQVVASGSESLNFQQTVQFLYDWSYDYTKDYTTEPILSAPILRKIPRNAPLIYSATIGNTYIEILKNGDFSMAFNSAFRVNNISTLPGESVAINIFDLTNVEGNEVRVYGGNSVNTYTIVDSCYRYMLYYLNAYGGWDFLLVEGKDMQTDNYTRHTIGQAYNNDISRNRGTRNYRNDISRKWQLHTLWIDDAGAQNMHHLLGSTDVYLYDMQTEQLYPITLDNPQCEYKTYSNNGNQLVRFDIEATLAQNLTRR